jgi:hypothetical protein
MGYNESFASSRLAMRDYPIPSKGRKERPYNCYLLAYARTFRIRAVYEMCYGVEPLFGFVPHAVDLYFRSSVETGHVGYCHDNEGRSAGCAHRSREACR